MSVAILALTAALAAFPAVDAPASPAFSEQVATVEADRPGHVPSAHLTQQAFFRPEDAPTSVIGSVAASGATSFTGFVLLTTLGTGLPAGLPMSAVSFNLRLATSLFLMSTGPSVGDLLNQDVGGFLVGALGRSALVGLGWGAVMLASQPDNGVLDAASAALVVTMAALAWTGWCAADLLRSLFAPYRWAQRQNERLLRDRSLPPPAHGPFARAY